MTPVPANLLTRVNLDPDRYYSFYTVLGSSSIYMLGSWMEGQYRNLMSDFPDAAIMWDAYVDVVGNKKMEPRLFSSRAETIKNSNLHNWFVWASGKGHLFSKRHNTYASDNPLCFHVWDPYYGELRQGVSADLITKHGWSITYTNNRWAKPQCQTLQILNKYGLLPECPHV